MHDESEAELETTSRNGGSVAAQKESAVAREVAQRIQHAIGPCASARVRRTAVRWSGHNLVANNSNNNKENVIQHVAHQAVAPSSSSCHQDIATVPSTTNTHTASVPQCIKPPLSTHTGAVHIIPCHPDDTTTNTIATNSNDLVGEMPEGVEEVLRAMDATQRAAACFASDAALLIQAGAGSGKTQTMAARVAVLLARGVPAQSVLGICFTRQAAETLRARVRAVLPVALRHSTQFLKLKTLHAFALECLRRFGRMDATTEVYDAGRQRRLARRVVAAHATQQKSAEAVEQLVEYVNRVKTRPAASALESYTESQSAYLYSFYQYELHEVCHAIDFGDLLQLFLELLRTRSATNEANAFSERSTTTTTTTMPTHAKPSASDCSRDKDDSLNEEDKDSARAILRRQYSHIVVDEFQDLNEVQLEILAQLAGPACRVTCVGDPNQCIYAWRGAVPEVFALWCRRFPNTTLHTLGMNYRSESTIVALTNQLVRGRQTAWRTTTTHEGNGALTSSTAQPPRRALLISCETDMEELEALPYIMEELLPCRNPSLCIRGTICYGSIAVLCRTRRRVQACCDYLRRRGIPVKELKRILPDAISPVRALLAYLRLCLTSDDSEHTSSNDEEEVRTALTLAPVHLASKTAKAFFFALDAVCQGRRRQQQQQQKEGSVQQRRFTSSGEAADTKLQATSYYAVLRELVYHDFAAAAYPKLQLGKAGQKVIRHFIRVTLRAQEMLRECTSADGVEQVLRYVCEEGGFAVAITTTPARVETRRSGVTGGKRGRSSAGTSAALADSVAAELSTAPTPQKIHNSNNSYSTTSAVDEVIYTPAEETALLAGAQGGSLTQLLLDAYHTVRISVDQEARAASLACSGIEGTGKVSHEPHAALVLRRVIDELTTVVPTDNFGQLRFPTGTSADEASKVKEGGPGKTTEGTEIGTHGTTSRVKIEEATTGTTTQEALAKNTNASTFDDVPEDNSVTVTTVHQAKGMEWPAVIVPGCWVGEFPVRAKSEEEKRVFYVALSRAMSDLILLTAKRDARDDDVGTTTTNKGSGWPQQNGKEGGAGEARANGGGEHGLQRCPYLTALEKEIDALSFAELKERYLRHRGQL